MATPNHEFPSLALIRQGLDYRFKIRTRGLELSVRPLSIFEEDRIAQEVIDELEKLPTANRTSLRQSILLSLKKLETAQTSDVGAHDPQVREIELQRLTPPELDHLFKQYVAGCDKLNPMLERMKADDIEAVVATLKKSMPEKERILTELSFFQLVDICLHSLSTGGSPEDR